MSFDGPALRLANLSKSFGKIRAVDSLSLEVYPGEMVGFLGPNGAGKSTTLYMIAGLVHPSGGRIEILGHDVRRDFKRAMSQAGTMVETPAFYNYLSGRKNVELAARLRQNVNSDELDTILKGIGLWHRRNDKVGAYSHGMKQRLGLGVALLGQPKLILLDEPTTGMDPEATRDILAMLQERVRRDGLAVFLSSHLMYEVEESCDRVIVINHGQLIASGNVKDILAPRDDVVMVTFNGRLPGSDELLVEDGVEHVEQVSPDTYEITLEDRTSHWLNGLLVGRNYHVSAIAPRQKTLKDFFLSVTGEEIDANNGHAAATQ